YVTRIEPEHNRIVLGNEEDLYSQRVAVSGIRWVAGKPPPRPINVAARTRYRSRETEATLCLKGQGADVCLAEPQRAVTPGQAIVFYDGDEVLGGGTIESSEPGDCSDRKA
ncbi:MAG: tRNA 2-thiouridine(34) synthase MnmA, partial [Dehalococcoidia bacterium]|nr:tRNA 2-thiouridine(34) synthase MnmA [Dehalococcoidia bacterium]